MPVSTILAIIQALVQIEPLAAEIIPILQKMLTGVALTAADITSLDATETALNTKLAAQVAAITPSGS
jgi:hypothetical protein